jgi:IMP dehydrogenase
MSDQVRSGFSAEELFARGKAITYSGFKILNTRFSQISKDQVDLETHLGKGISLKTPIIASPMDTVTNARLAIAIAREGGIACIHYNHQDHNKNIVVDEQVDEIIRVKRAQNGFIENPITLSPDMTIAQAIEMGERHKIGEEPIRVFPVTENGKSGSKLVGLLRSDDYFRKTRTDSRVRDRMLARDKLITADLGIGLEDAREMLWGNKIKSLPIVDSGDNLVYLVTRGDVELLEQFPGATVDEKGRLRVLFSVSTWQNPSYERLEKGFAAGADGVIVDTSQGHSRFAHEMLRHIAEKYPDKLLIGGNISTAEAATALARLGFVDAYRCGQGSGSICTTSGAIGVGRSGASGVYECARATRESGIVTIADGGLKEPGDIHKALALGAGAVMLGNLLASTAEAPGEMQMGPDGVPIKKYRGMGSSEANAGGGLRGYTRFPEGVPGFVTYHGSVHEWVPLLMDAVKHGFEVDNCREVRELHEAMYSGEIRFEEETHASLQESKPHSLKGR